ncbi:MAG: hypothetical protein ACTS4V_01240 [Candidatus Hodgkinia cicadicola]
MSLPFRPAKLTIFNFKLLPNLTTISISFQTSLFYKTPNSSSCVLRGTW